MESTMFTELSFSEEASLSGGYTGGAGGDGGDGGNGGTAINNCFVLNKCYASADGGDGGNGGNGGNVYPYKKRHNNKKGWSY